MAKVVEDFDFSIRKPMNLKDWFNGQTWELSAEDFIAKDKIPGDVHNFLQMKARSLKAIIAKTNEDGSPRYEFNWLETRVMDLKLYIRAVNRDK
jgi:hypothetical protein